MLWLFPLWMSRVAGAEPAEEGSFAEVHADWNRDGKPDRAALVDGEEDAVLVVTLSSPDGGVTSRHGGLAKGGSGGMAGTAPYLELTARGSLRIVSENSSVGRDRWTETLTVAFRDGQLVVAGYTYSSYDTLAPERGVHSCDVNLLTGSGVRDGKKFETALRKVPLASWTSESIVNECE